MGLYKACLCIERLHIASSADPNGSSIAHLAMLFLVNSFTVVPIPHLMSSSSHGNCNGTLFRRLSRALGSSRHPPRAR